MDAHGERRIALVLGAGAARGWAHIGVIRALDEAGIRLDMVCGTSIGALVGAALASDRLDGLEKWIRGLGHLDVLGLLDPGFAVGGFIHGAKLMKAFAAQVEHRNVEDLPMTFATVATDIESGREIWLKRGPLIAAVQASIAIPGMFAPVCVNGRWLVDGGLVNPVPVSVARALDADLVIAVNVNERVGVPGGRRRYSLPGQENGGAGWWERVSRWWTPGAVGETPPPLPGIFAVSADSINIMQNRIMRARLAGEPADVLVSPRVGHIGILEFNRADEAIEEGYRCAQGYIAEIERLLEQ